MTVAQEPFADRADSSLNRIEALAALVALHDEGGGSEQQSHGG